MREIKFRAWNEDEDRWATCDEFSQVKINPTLDQFGGGSVGADLQNMAAVEVGTGNLVLMQYTGLHDKNGKEIYEGDILHSHENSWVVKYGKGCFVCDGPDLGKGNLLHHVLFFRNRAGIPLEVIGNVGIKLSRQYLRLKEPSTTGKKLLRP